MKQIKFCLVFTNQNYSKIVTNVLLKLGIPAFNITDITECMKMIKSKKIDFLFLDFDFADKASFNLINQIKEDQSLSSICIIATSFNTTEKFIKKINQYNVISFISKPITEKKVFEKTKKILNKFKNHFSKRQHIRIKPEKDELMRISIKLRNDKRLTCKVIDVSLGGIAGLLYNKFEDPQLQPGNLIEHLKFEANNKEIDVDAKVISKKDTFVAFKYTHFYNETYSELTRYIIKKLSV